MGIATSFSTLCDRSCLLLRQSTLSIVAHLHHFLSLIYLAHSNRLAISKRTHKHHFNISPRPLLAPTPSTCTCSSPSSALLSSLPAPRLRLLANLPSPLFQAPSRPARATPLSGLVVMPLLQ